MHFLVIGGAGFIGSHLVEALLMDDHQVTVIDDFSSGKPENLPSHPKLRVICQDILEVKVNEITRDVPDFEGVAHLVATPSVELSWLNPLAAHHNNLSATLAVLRLCQELQIPRLVIASSAAVYGEQKQLPIKENQTNHPISPYGLQKLVSEQYMQLFTKKYGFSGVALRLFNVFGLRQNPGSPYSGVISIFKQRIEKSLPVIIYGNGLQTRDFVYVEDVAQAFVKSLTLTTLKPGESIVCNIGTQKETSLLKLVEILKSCLPFSLSNIEYQETRIGDIHNSLADISQAYRLLDFQPIWTIESGLKEATNVRRNKMDC